MIDLIQNCYKYYFWAKIGYSQIFKQKEVVAKF